MAECSENQGIGSMLLRAHQQIAISSVKARSIRPGEVFEVSETHGVELLKAHPDKIKRIESREFRMDAKPMNKAEPKPMNKAIANTVSNSSEGLSRRSSK